MPTTEEAYDGIMLDTLVGDLHDSTAMRDPRAAELVRDHIKTAALLGIYAELVSSRANVTPAGVPDDWEPVTDAAGNVAGYLHPELAEKVATALGAERTPETVGGNTEPVEPKVGMRAAPRGDDGVAIVRSVGMTEGAVVVRLSWLPDPRDTETTDEEVLARVTGPLLAEGFIFDEFPDAAESELVALAVAADMAERHADPAESDELDDDFTPPAEAPDAFAAIKKGKAKK